MAYELTDHLEYRGRDFQIESKIGETNNFSIETNILQQGQMLFSRKINYAYLLKKETNIESINDRLKIILKNQHHDVISNLKGGQYNNLINFQEEPPPPPDRFPPELLEEEPDLLVLPLKEDVVQRINRVIDSLKTELGDDLLLAYLRDSEGNALTGYSVRPETLEIFRKIADKIRLSSEDMDYPKFGKHYILDIMGPYLVIVIPLEHYHWGMMVQISEGQLNELLNRLIPQSINAFEKAVLP